MSMLCLISRLGNVLQSTALHSHRATLVDTVYMPEITAGLQVISDLPVVQADMIIGVDIIASLGGVADHLADFQLLDIRKAYLRVHTATELQRYQVLVWQG